MIEMRNAEALEELTKDDMMFVNVNDDNNLKELPVLAEEMFQYCMDNKGEALSACQVGIDVRFFVMRTRENQFALVVNPSYYKNGSRYQVTEGCLSYPDRAFTVKRYRRIKTDFWTIHEGAFIYQRESITGYAAEIFQHETDHCNAKTIVQIGKEVE